MELRPFALLALVVAAPSINAQVLSAQKVLGGSGIDSAAAIATDAQGNVFIAGSTTSLDFPLVNPLFSKIPDAALRMSTDGVTFRPSTFQIPNITAIAASSDGRILLAADQGAIYRSVNGGATWGGSTANVSGNVVALAIDPVNPSSAYAVSNLNTSAQFLRSTDGGITWQSSPAPGSGPGVAVSRILIDPQNPSSIYAFFGNALDHSSDSGNTWQSVLLSNPDGAPAGVSVLALAMAPSQSQTLYAVTNFAGVQKSVDGGATWQPIATFSTTNVNTFAVDPNNPNVFWFAGYQGIGRSLDGGASVQIIKAINADAWQSIAIDPNNSNHIFAADAIHLYVTLDGGATWAVAASGQFASVLATPLGIYAAGSPPPTLFLTKLDATLSHILFSTFIGPAETSGIALAVDEAGNPLITGSTQWTDFPTTPTALQPAFASGTPGFAVKVRADGGALIYSTLLNNFTPRGAALDAGGNAVIVGSVQPSFAVLNAYQSTIPGPCTRQPVNVDLFPPSQPAHAFVAKLSADGGSLLYATYLTGSCGDAVNAVQLDSAGNAYVTGFTDSLDFPVTPNAMTQNFPGPKTTYDAGFVSELSADGAHLLYSSFFGGGENNSGNAIALDGRGNVFVAGSTQATASAGALAVVNPTGCEYIINIGPSVDESYEYVDGFVMKLALNGAPPAFLATVGGSCQDAIQSLSLDGAGNIWVAGSTASADFPLRAPIGAFGPGNGGFVAELDPSGSSLLFSTFTGGQFVLERQFAGLPTVAATGNGAYVATTIQLPPTSNGDFSEPSKSAPSAFTAFIDGSQSPELALDAIQTPSSSPQPELPSFQAPSVAPGQLLTLRGRGIGPAVAVTAQPTSGMYPDALAGVQVTFNGIAAPLVSVQANRILCQAPFELDGAATAAIQVRFNGQNSNTFAAAVVAQQFGVLGVVNADGTANSASNPAPVGSVVSLYLTGAGQIIPPGVDGALNGGVATVPRTTPVIYVNGNQIQPAYFGPAPGESTAVFQLNITAAAPLPSTTAVLIAIYPTSGIYEATTPLYVK